MSAPFAIRLAAMLVESRCCLDVHLISHDVYSERSYALRALQISQNADIVEARILVQVRERRASGSRDEWIFISLLLSLVFFFFFVLLFFSHYCSLWLRETTAPINMFPRARRPKETMLYLALFCLSDIITLRYTHLPGRINRIKIRILRK